MRRVTLGIAALLLATSPIAYGQQPAGQSQGVGQPAAAAAVPVTFNVKVIATAAFAQNINELRSKLEQVQGEFKPQADQLNGMRTEMGRIENQIQTQGQSLKPEVLAGMQQQHQKLQFDFKQLQERTETEYNSRVRDLVGPVYQKISKFMETYAAQRSISLILDVSNQAETQTIAFVGADADITQDFINEYNRQNPVAATSTAPPPQQPRNPPPATNPNNRPRPGGGRP